MTATDLDERAADLRLDWLLRERLGGEAPPDVTERVLAALARRNESPRPHRRWLAVAVVLLGAAVVVAVAFDAAMPRAQQGAPQDPTSAPEPVRVGSLADVEALPADTRAVLGVDLDDAAVTALLRLRQLEQLELSVGALQDIGRDLRPLPDPDAATCVTDEALARLAALPRLRALALDGQTRVRGEGLLRVVDGCPLRELTLTRMTVSDALLRDVCRATLRAIRLDHSEGFGRDGLRAVAACSTVQVVSLRGCRSVESAAVAELGALRGLERLDLGMAGVVNGTGGLTTDVFAALAELPDLRALDLAVAWRDASGRVQKARAAAPPAAWLGALPGSLQQLSLAGHVVDGEALVALLERPALRELDLSWCPRTPRDHDEPALRRALLAALARRQQPLERLAVVGWTFPDEERARLLRGVGAAAFAPGDAAVGRGR